MPRALPRNRIRVRSGVLLAVLGIVGLAGAATAADHAHLVELGDTGIYVPICGHAA